MRQNLTTLCVCCLLLQAAVVSAASSVEVFGTTQAPLSLQLELATVGDSVNYTPNLPQGGFAEPEKKSRYQSHKASLDWRPGSHWLLNAALAQSDLTSLRDSFKLSSYELAAELTLPATIPGTKTTLRVATRSNRSNNLHKNSFTQINDNSGTQKLRTACRFCAAVH